MERAQGVAIAFRALFSAMSMPDDAIKILDQMEDQQNTEKKEAGDGRKSFV